MRIHSVSLIPHPRERVFGAYRDRLPEVVPYLPDIREIRVHSRVQEGGVVRLHNEWISDRDVPSFARAFVSPEMLRWSDHATWREDDSRCDWVITVPAFADLVTCRGHNSIQAVDPDTTRVVLEGELRIDGEGLRGMPGLLAGRLAPKVEKLIVSLVTPNLERVNSALGEFLDAQERGAG